MKLHEAILVGIVKNFVVEALSTCRVKSHENLASERGFTDCNGYLKVLRLKGSWLFL